jgi:hypothetical protein
MAASGPRSTATYRYLRNTSLYRFSHIHADLVGPLPVSKGFTYLFTINDRTSRWPEAIPIAPTTTVDCANSLFQGWVSRFGVPAVITSDRGTQFTSSLWAALCSLLNIQHNQTAYHPQSNGMVEHFHRRLKDALRAHCAAANWVDHLPWVLVGLRVAAREDDGSTPAQAVFSEQLILPGQFLDSPELPSKIFLEQFSKTLSAAEHTATRHNAAAARRPLPLLPDDLARAPMVFVRRDGHVLLLQPLYDSPYAVICRSLHHFTLRIADKEDKVSTLRLKPCTDPTAPPRVRGRPPAAIRFQDFPLPGAAAAHRVRFAPQQPAEPRREPFSPGPPPGVFARPAAVLDNAGARPARNRRAPSRSDL